MSHFVIIPVFTILLTLALIVIVVVTTKRKKKSSDERLQDEFIYRKEPHGDQTTEHPNRLSDNEITKG